MFAVGVRNTLLRAADGPSVSTRLRASDSIAKETDGAKRPPLGPGHVHVSGEFFDCLCPIVISSHCFHGDVSLKDDIQDIWLTNSHLN